MIRLMFVSLRRCDLPRGFLCSWENIDETFKSMSMPVYSTCAVFRSSRNAALARFHWGAAHIESSHSGFIYRTHNYGLCEASRGDGPACEWPAQRLLYRTNDAISSTNVSKGIPPRTGPDGLFCYANFAKPLSGRCHTHCNIQPLFVHLSAPQCAAIDDGTWSIFADFDVA